MEREYRYSYKVYNTYFRPRRHIMDVGGVSPTQAIKKAGFDWIPEAGGKIVKTRRGKGYTNTAIEVYLPETANCEKKCGPDYVLERIF